MQILIQNLWYRLSSSFWFIPVLMTAAAIGASIGMIELDHAVKDDLLLEFSWIYSGDAGGSTAILSAIASSMVTVAGVVFSITVVALSLASSQFGPRLLNNFMRDRGSQAVLGIFISTFIYCLLVMRKVRGSESNDPFVPHISVTFGVLLALVSFIFLIYFIHHIAVSIQADHVITHVWEDLEGTIDTLYPEELGHEPEEVGKKDDAVLAGFPSKAVSIKSLGTGYLQTVDAGGIMGIATGRNLIIRLEYRPGDFVVEGDCLALVWPVTAAFDDLTGLTQEINESIYLGRQRTPVQDMEFGINQLVEIAIRALSPGINDTFTALTCIDRLGATMSRLASRKIPPPYRYDDSGNLRVIAYPLSFSQAVDAAFNLIRRNANVATIMRLLESLCTIARSSQRQEDFQVLLRHADMVKGEAERKGIAQDDMAGIRFRYELLRRTISERAGGAIAGTG